MASDQGKFELPDLEMGPSVRELSPTEPSTFRPDSIELADVPPRRASARPEIPAQRAHGDMAHGDMALIDVATLDVHRANVDGLNIVEAAPRRPPQSPSYAPVAPIARAAQDAEITRAPTQFESTFQYDTPLVNAYSLPGAFAFALLIHAIHLGTTVFMTVGMWTHELGHAIAAWFSGILAIPLPFVTIATSMDRSVFVILLVAAAWIALGAYGLRNKNRALVFAAVMLGIIQIWMTGVMSPGRANQWILFAGMGGEIVLSTIGVLAFYQRFPLRWDFWRYLVLVTSAVAYVHALIRWIGVGLGITEMPHGAASGDNAEGDVERLVRTHEFTIPALARTYLVLTLVCGGVMVLAYLFYLRRARIRARGEDPREASRFGAAG